MIEAAEAAGVKRFIVNDFGWGPEYHSLPEFSAIHAHRRTSWNLAKAKAEANPTFTFTGITTGNPIDWVRLGYFFSPYFLSGLSYLCILSGEGCNILLC